MNDFFPNLLLGHMVGDYLLQNNWMAMNKSGSTLKCAVHCGLYTIAVSIATWSVSLAHWQWPLLVFASHFPIDRWSLADKWLHLIRGRALSDFMERGGENIPFEYPDHRRENYKMLRAAFGGVVYTAADNTMHLAAMYWGARLLGWA